MEIAFDNRLQERKFRRSDPLDRLTKLCQKNTVSRNRPGPIDDQSGKTGSKKHEADNTEDKANHTAFSKGVCASHYLRGQTPTAR